MVRLTDRPDMTLGVYRGRKTTIQQYNGLSNVQMKLTISTTLSAEFTLILSVVFVHETSYLMHICTLRVFFYKALSLQKMT